MKNKAREWRYCAYCGNQRRVYLKAHIGAWDMVGCVFLGLMMMAPISGGLDPRGLGLSAVFCAFAEVFTVLRHRVNLRCSKCGFDPVVYRKSHEEAAKMVRAHAERRASSPEGLMSGPVRSYMGQKTSSQRKSKEKQSRQSNAPQQM